VEFLGENLLGLLVHQDVMGKTGAARCTGFAVSDDFFALLLHAITSFRFGWWNKAHSIWLRRMLFCFVSKRATSRPRGYAPTLRLTLLKRLKS
jgi:hypothetical protein